MICFKIKEYTLKGVGWERLQRNRKSSSRVAQHCSTWYHSTIGNVWLWIGRQCLQTWAQIMSQSSHSIVADLQSSCCCSCGQLHLATSSVTYLCLSVATELHLYFFFTVTGEWHITLKMFWNWVLKHTFFEFCLILWIWTWSPLLKSYFNFSFFCGHAQEIVPANATLKTILIN